MERQFRISFTCDEKQLPTLISLLTQEVRAISVAETIPTATQVNGPAIVAARMRDHHIAAIKNTANTRSGKIVLDVLSRKKVGVRKDFIAAMVNAGFHPTSYSPILSRLKHAGLVRSLGDGKWELTGREQS